MWRRPVVSKAARCLQATESHQRLLTAWTVLVIIDRSHRDFDSKSRRIAEEACSKKRACGSVGLSIQPEHEVLGLNLNERPPERSRG